MMQEQKLEEVKINEDKLSRQIATLDKETMIKLIKQKVFIFGLKGVGIETAKNIILANPHSVTVHDDDIVQINHLGTNFYLNEAQVGKTKISEACFAQLKDLNNDVDVRIHTGLVTQIDLLDYDVIAFTDFYDFDKLVEIDNFCRVNKKGFIYSGHLGLYGFCFVDFGIDHKINDKDGEQLKSAPIQEVTNDKEALIICCEGQMHDLEDGDLVTITEVQGIEFNNKSQINNLTFSVKVVNPFRFRINLDTRNFSQHVRKGIFTQVKQKFIKKFYSLEQTLENPFNPDNNELVFFDQLKMEAPVQLHIGLRALLKFVNEKNQHQLPQLFNEEQAKAVLQIAKDINEENKKSGKQIKVDQVDENLILNLCRYSRTQISPQASFWGGIVAQEIIKFTGKYTPLYQWFHYECFETLHSQQVDRKPLNCRYDDIIALFGREFFEQIRNQKTFLIGAGALGCEFLKVFALLGLGVGKGQVFVTDNDLIELSNLNRQFLFRSNNIKKPKSECAIAAIQKINPEFKGTAYQKIVGKSTIDFFHDDFWDNLDLVVTAVDNVDARRYVDSQCVWYNKPLFESGTLGPKCHSQVILPGLTKTYGEEQEPPEKEVPACTLKNFPYKIEHCIIWAREYFQGIFVDAPNDCKKLLENPVRFFNERKSMNKGEFRKRLELMKYIVDLLQNPTYDQCVALARILFSKIFSHQIIDLLNCFPKDYKLPDGRLFWDGTKRCPTPLKFDINDKIQIEFIQSCANILANIIGLNYCHDVSQVQNSCSKIKEEQYQAKKITAKIDENDKTQEGAEDDDVVIQNLTTQFQSLKNLKTKTIVPNEFEKDDPNNWHIEFTAALANLRAANYQIEKMDKLKIKFIAGRIIPAMATTTAMVVGLVSIEILKYILKRPFETFKSSFSNLSRPFWLLTDPDPAKKNIQGVDPIYIMGPWVGVPKGFTIWDKIEIKAPITIQQLLDMFKNKYNVKIDSITYGDYPIYGEYIGQSNTSFEILQYVKDKYNVKFGEQIKFTELGISGLLIKEDNTTIDAKFPRIRLQIK